MNIKLNIQWWFDELCFASQFNIIFIWGMATCMAMRLSQKSKSKILMILENTFSTAYLHHIITIWKHYEFLIWIILTVWDPIRARHLILSNDWLSFGWTWFELKKAWKFILNCKCSKCYCDVTPWRSCLFTTDCLNFRKPRNLSIIMFILDSFTQRK
jgi:hypothetical protein